MNIFGFDFGKPIEHRSTSRIPSVTLYYYLFLALVVVSVIICYRLERSRIGRAWMAIREDEIAAKAMGINTRNMKLLAFGMGATFGGVSGAMFASFQGFVSPESFSADGVDDDRRDGRARRHRPHPGRDPRRGAAGRAARGAALRGRPAADMTGGRLDASILRQLLIALAMIGIMLLRPRGLWPSPEHGKAAPAPTAGQVRSTRHDAPIVLKVAGVSKRFGGLQALSDVGITIQRRPGLRPDRPQRRRQDHLLQRASPACTRPTRGSFELGGKPYKPTAVHEVAKAGIARTFQNIRLFAEMTALENVMVGRHVRTHSGLLGAVFRTGGFKAEEAAIAKRAQELLDYVGIGKLRRVQGAHAELRRPAPAGDRPRAGHRPEADRARRAGRRHERHREDACCAS